MKETTVLIADDHAIVRMGLAALLEPESGIRVIGEADDGDVAIRKTMRNKPDIVIMDIMMPVRDGISATQEIKSRLPHTRVLILTTSTVSDDLSRALEAGADGAITKSNANAQLLTAIRAIAAGKRWVSPEIEKQIATDPPVQKLTERQEQVLSSIVRGLTNADIAHQLGIREDSVKEHLNLIFSKIGAANRAEAVAIALRRHLLRF
ncbi:MAG: response regulator transcription factor [Kiritimatiellia bacterium]|nr:response regulator transcription factor [Kiritimatiellia bacterium]